MKRLLLGMLGCLFATVTLADGVRAVQERVEDSMLVTGTIGVTPQGTVLGYTLDHPEKLPPAVGQVVGETLPRWTFRPVLSDGRPVAAKATMSLRLVARPLGGGKYKVVVHSAYFGDPSEGVKPVKTARVLYPRSIARDRISATVYVLLRVDRSGRVVDAATEQVNLQTIADDEVLKRYRKLFAEASVKGLSQWTFTPAAPSDPAPYRVVRMPVAYSVWPEKNVEPYGQWRAYVPGPVQPVPWLDDDKLLTGGADALPGDGIFGPSTLSLLTPLDPG
jgi:hypothetical protein